MTTKILQLFLDTLQLIKENQICIQQKDLQVIYTDLHKQLQYFLQFAYQPQLDPIHSVLQKNLLNNLLNLLDVIVIKINNYSVSDNAEQVEIMELSFGEQSNRNKELLNQLDSQIGTLQTVIDLPENADKLNFEHKEETRQELLIRKNINIQSKYFRQQCLIRQTVKRQMSDMINTRNAVIFLNNYQDGLEYTQLKIQSFQAKIQNFKEQITETIQKTQMIDNQISECRIKQLFCPDCKERMLPSYKQFKTQKFLQCQKCNKILNMNKKNTRVDRNEHTQKNTSYQAIKHFDVVFKYIFISPTECVPTDIKQELIRFMERDQKQKVTIEDVRQYLKQLPGGKGSKLNKLDAVIMQQLNREPQVQISSAEYNFIKDVYYQVVNAFYFSNVQRQNTPSASYFIKCIIDLFYKDYDPKRHQSLIRLIKIQKEATILKIQKVWGSIIPKLDVYSLKKNFMEMMQKYSKN